ncbi:MAG TPA: HD-GYP domain-containing protein [Clostridiales bacterium]|nr:HD-GYP domain-containing protein [Clostridiales bacterium]
MRAVRILTNKAVTGMVTANDIYTRNNQLIITEGTVLNSKVIDKLRFYKIYGLNVYPKKQKEEESYIEELRKTPEFKKFNHTYVDTVDEVASNFDGIITGDQKININHLLQETDRILSEGRNATHIMEMLHGIRDYDDLTYVHSMNVSLICNIFGGWLKLPKREIRNLTLAGLLHDIGKLLIPKEILSKPDKLNSREYEIMKAHTIKGYEALKDLPIDIDVKYAALMHHERQDGSGYPNRFGNSQISKFAKIVSIADVYDAMTSNRIYRKAFCPFAVVEDFEREGFIKFDSRYLVIFLERIVESYLHNLVKLSDGREGEVVLINKFSLSKPMVRVGDDFVDLSKEHNIRILSIL